MYEKIKTSRGLTKLGFKAGYYIEDDKEDPKYMKFLCSKCHLSGSLESIQKEYIIQPHLMKDEINDGLITFGT